MVRAVWGDIDLTAYPYVLAADPYPDFGVGPVEYVTGADADAVDGEVVSSTRTANREITLGVWVMPMTVAELEAACARLEKQAEQRGSVLTVDPGQLGATAWAIDTYRAQTVLDAEAHQEAQLVRFYTVTIPAAPFLRSVDEIVTEAVTDGGEAVTPVATTLYSGSGTTGWVAAGGPLAAASGGGVQVTRGALGGMTLTSPAYSWGTDLWMSAHVGVSAPTGSGASTPMAAWSGLPARAADAIYGGRHYWLLDAAPTDGKVTFSGFTPTVGTLIVRNVRRHNVPPGPSPKQLQRTIEVQGTARTPVSLSVTHPTTGLGRVTAYSWPDDGSGYQPACRSYLTSTHTITESTTAVSGSYATLTTSAPGVVDIPAGAVPRGLYRILGRFAASGTLSRTLTVKAWTRVGGINYTEEVRTVGAGFVGTSPRLVDFGRGITLPTAALPDGSAGTVRLEVSTTGDVDLDELWLFNTETGALASVSVGTGKGVWIDSPTLQRPYPAIWVSATVDKAQARHAEQSAILYWEALAWPAGRQNLFTVCDADNAIAQARYYARGRHSIDV